MKLVEGGALDQGDVASLADRLEIGERHLRRLFRQHIGAAPVTVAQTRRVLLAKQLIHQTDLSMIQVAMASGFASVRRFNETFQQLYNRPPSQLRRRKVTASSPEISLLLPYRPPYDWASMLRFLELRAISGLEQVTHDCYSRVIQHGDATGSFTVSHMPAQSALRVIVRFPRLNALSVIVARVRRMFDLSADPTAIATALSADRLLAPLVAARPGLRLPGGWNGFEIAVRAILGQQITVKGATQLATRIVLAMGDRVEESGDRSALTHAFPHPSRFDETKLQRVGLSQSRVAALANIAVAMTADPHLFDTHRDLDHAVTQLRKLPGIGEWAAQYIAMRAMGESDAFLAADIGIRRNLARNGLRPTAVQVSAMAERWRPWRAYAMLHLWMTESDNPTFLSTKEIRHALET